MTEMDDELSISLVIILVVGGMMITALLVCYACIFRDLCCQRVDRAKRRRAGRRSPGCGSDDIIRARMDAIQLNDITQADSMPTESEKV
uniref:Uncharacterized protein n=1 Tax=Bracon brevicornis TaxID=1563983 RepID=A0A6V7HS58_9HYME